MIRSAGHDDMERLLDMGERFAALARLEDSVTFDRDSVARTLAFLIDSGVLLMTENAAIGGLVTPHPFNNAVLIAQELFWWSEGDGLGLLAEFEAEARARGAALSSMVALEAVRPEAVGRLYERHGYARLEHTYLKRL